MKVDSFLRSIASCFDSCSYSTMLAVACLSSVVSAGSALVAVCIMIFN